MVGFTDGNSAPNARQIPMTPDRGHNGYVWTKASQMSATDGSQRPIGKSCSGPRDLLAGLAWPDNMHLPKHAGVGLYFRSTNAQTRDPRTE